MAALDVLGIGKAASQWLPFATFTDSERMAEAALAAKTLVAEVRRRVACVVLLRVRRAARRAVAWRRRGETGDAMPVCRVPRSGSQRPDAACFPARPRGRRTD